MVPAGPAREVGFDRSLIAAYGHDDRVCAYAAFKPLLDLGTPVKTAVCVLADKEEIGSVGISGMQSQYFEMFMEDLCEATAQASAAASSIRSACPQTSATRLTRCMPRPATRRTTRRSTTAPASSSIPARAASPAAPTQPPRSWLCAPHLCEARRHLADRRARQGRPGRRRHGRLLHGKPQHRDRRCRRPGAVHACSMEIVSKLDTYMTFKGMKVFYEEN